MQEQERSVHRRLGLQDVIIEQIGKVATTISNGGDATNAIGALYVLCTPYTKDLRVWKNRWDNRKVRTVTDEETGEVVPIPSGKDNQDAFELIMDGLSEAGVLFERVRVSYVGKKEPELGLGSHGLETNSSTGKGGVDSPSGIDGGGFTSGNDMGGNHIGPSMVSPMVPPVSLGKRLDRHRKNKSSEDAQSQVWDDGDVPASP